jgi:hypothetical protein
LPERSRVRMNRPGKRWAISDFERVLGGLEQ